MKKIDLIFDPVLAYHAERVLPQMTSSWGMSLSAHDRLKQLGTVRLKVGRQLGNSWYIARTAAPDDIIFGCNLVSLDTMRKRCDEFGYSEAFGHTGCKNIRWMRAGDEIEGTFKNVWIDDATYARSEDLDWLYRHLAGRCDRFILIG